MLEQLRTAGEWYFTPGFRRLDPDYVRGPSRSAPRRGRRYFDQMRRQTLPPEALLIRRMEALLFAVLGELRAGADWGTLAASTSSASRRRPSWAAEHAFWELRTGR